MTDFVDGGRRCSSHVGEVFPPRCAECARLNETSTVGGAGQLAHGGTDVEGPWAVARPLPDPWVEE